MTLELLGQAFGLDVSDEKIISQVTELYRKWLLTDNKPAPLRDDVEFYLVVRITMTFFYRLFLNLRLFEVC